MIDFDEIRKEAAIKHGVLLDKDDPVLATVTINEHVLSRYVEILSTQNEAHQKALTLALGQGIEESKKISGRIVTEGANYVTDRCKEVIAEAMAVAVAEARAEVKNELVNAKKAIGDVGTTVFVQGIVFTCVSTAAITLILLKVFM